MGSFPRNLNCSYFLKNIYQVRTCARFGVWRTGSVATLLAYLRSFVVEEKRFQCYWDTTYAHQIVNTTPLLFHFSARHANTQCKPLFSLNTAGRHNLAEVIVI